MELDSFLHLTALTIGLCASYVLLSFLYSAFFAGRWPAFNLASSLLSIALIAIFSVGVYVVVFFTPDLELGNRLLHVFGGGFLAFLVCFLVVRNGNLPITRFQFLVFSFLIVMTYGVFNEVIEYYLQKYDLLVAARGLNDTWLDLLSNLVGAALGALAFTPFVRGRAPTQEE